MGGVFLSDPDAEKIKAERLSKMQEEFGKKRAKKLEIEVNDVNFETEVIEKSGSIPVVVDFWATWCAPCLMLSPTLEKLAKEFEGKFASKLFALSD